jgi:hypothetical protein
VIGAGASVDLGLPTGDGLRKRALDMEKGTPDAFQFLTHARNALGLDLVQAVLKELAKDTTAESIDEFLWSRQHRPEVVVVGRGLIALIIGRALSSTPRDGYKYLDCIIKKMREGTRSLQEFVKVNAGVRFVTFNFDSFIERRIERQLSAIFPDASDEDRMHARHAFEVLHVHGRLPDIPPKPLVFDSANGYLDDWFVWFADAVKHIRVVHDAVDSQAAEMAVSDARVLCFLGFNFHGTNLLRLRVDRAMRAREGVLTVVGSAKGIEPGRRGEIEDAFRPVKIILGHQDEDCLQVLKNYHVFR